MKISKIILLEVIPKLKIIDSFKMNDDYSENSFNFGFDPEENHWSQRDWVRYIKRADSEIGKIKSLYRVGKRNGLTLEEIAIQAGWPVNPYNGDSNLNDLGSQPEFSKDPLTLINHPIYIVSRALIKSLEQDIEVLVKNVPCSPMSVWQISKSLHEASRLIIVAVNSTDLGEDMLANSYYKSAIFCLNTIIAEIEKFDAATSSELADAKAMALTTVFDLRELCLNLS